MKGIIKMKRKTYVLLGLAVILTVTAVLFALPSKERNVLINVEKTNEKSFNVSLAVDEKKPVSEVGVIISSEKRIFPPKTVPTYSPQPSRTAPIR